MASEEIEAINSSNPVGWSNSSCVIEVGYDRRMKEEDIPDVAEARIFRVPKPLRDSNDQFYTPQFVSIGPFHYGKEKLKGMEKSKDEAVRRMQIRIQKNHPNISIKSFVEGEMLGKDKEIRKFYGEHISFATIELAWIVTRDACFLYEFLVNYFSGIDSKEYENEVTAFSWKYDAVFDVISQNPMREGIMNDILLFENQIPLWVLKDVLKNKLGTAEAAGQKLDELTDSIRKCLTRHQIFTWHGTPSHKRCSHVLEILYHGLVGEDIKSYWEWESNLSMQSASSDASSDTRLGNVGQTTPSSPSASNCMQSASSDTRLGNVGQTTPSSPSASNLMRSASSDTRLGNVGQTTPLSPSDMPTAKSAILDTRLGSDSVNLDLVKLPTALELTRAGVNIHPVTFRNRLVDESTAIQWVQFDEKEAVLYLPEIRVTQPLYSVMSKIIAMELSIDKYYPRPMTQYMLFMDELIDSEEDVAVLRKAEVINNFLKSNEQAADFFNTLGAGMSPFKWCKVTAEARRGLHKYMKRKYRILWSEFVSAYFSKPWLVGGSIAAVLLLWMTMAQVLCLFINCNP